MDVGIEINFKLRIQVDFKMVFVGFILNSGSLGPYLWYIYMICYIAHALHRFTQGDPKHG